jgi:hypothetical protein
MKHISPGLLLKPKCKFANGFKFVELFGFDHFSALLPIMPTIFPQCRQQRWSFFQAVVHKAKKLSTLWTTTWKNTHELKLEQFSAWLPTTRKNYWHCRQQRGTFFHVVGNSEKKCSLCGQQRGRIATTQNSITFFCAPRSTFKGTVYLN